MDREILRQTVDGIIRDFIARERQHMAMEERVFFPAAIVALQPQDWAEIASTLTDQRTRFSVRSSKSDSTRCESISCSWKRRLRRSAADRVLTDRRAGSQC